MRLGETSGRALFAGLLASCSPALAAGMSAQRATASDAYVFPVAPGTPEWSALASHEEMLAATQLPGELLAAMSTEGLVETVLRHPLFIDVLAYASQQEGFERLVLGFNGLPELLTRLDVGPVLLRRYRATELPGPSSGVGVMELGRLELLLAQHAVLASLAPRERRELGSRALAVARAKARDPHFFGAFSRERSRVLVARLLAAERSLPGASHPLPEAEGSLSGASHPLLAAPGGSLALTSHRGAGATSAGAPEELAQRRDRLGEPDEAASRPATRVRNPVTIYTPRRSVVPGAWLLVAGDMSEEERRGCTEEWAAAYPRAVVEGECTYRYNCHSFAWYRPMPNDVWLGMPQDPANPAQSVYWRDGSYTRVATASSIPPSVRPGARVAFEHADHSAIVASPTELVSKWHHAPLMRHPPGYGPYEATSLVFYECSAPEGCDDTQCAPGAREQRPCGACGSRSRRCNSWGYWEAWSPCGAVAESPACVEGELGSR